MNRILLAGTALLAIWATTLVQAKADTTFFWAPFLSAGVDQSNFLAGGGSEPNGTVYTGSGGGTIAASAFAADTVHPLSLFEKVTNPIITGDETGLGISGAHDGEIQLNQYIQLDISGMTGFTNFAIQMNSITTGQDCNGLAGNTCNGPSNVFEGFYVVGTNLAEYGVVGGTVLASCIVSNSMVCEGKSFSLGSPVGTYAFLDVVGTNGGDVLIRDITAVSAVPGPIVGAGIPGMFALGMLWLARLRQKRNGRIAAV